MEQVITMAWRAHIADATPASAGLFSKLLRADEQNELGTRNGLLHELRHIVAKLDVPLIQNDVDVRNFVNLRQTGRPIRDGRYCPRNS